MFDISVFVCLLADTITINRRQATDHRTKLAICHALAQVMMSTPTIQGCKLVMHALVTTEWTPAPTGTGLPHKYPHVQNADEN